MKFSEVLAIAGQSGLYKYLAHGKNGIIVESLADGRRFPVPSSAQVSALRDISIYTELEDKPLSEVFETMFEKLEGKPALSHKSAPAELAAAFAEYLPDYDQARVHASDIRKVFMWYNILQGTGMTEFVEKEEEAPAEKAE